MPLVTTILTAFALTLTLVRVSSFLEPEIRLPRVSMFDDVMFTDNILFEVATRSKLECVRHCASAAGCLTVTFSGVSQCRGHNVGMTTKINAVPSVRARTYVFKVPAWGANACATVNSCPTRVPNIACFNGKCVCAPGYFRSVSTRTCLAQCPWTDLQNTFILYAGWRILDSNLDIIPSKTLAECKSLCITNYPRCRTIEHQVNPLTCNVAEVTVLDVPPQAWDKDSYDYYQRECA